MIKLADTCPICGDHSEGSDYCDWCRSEARDFLKTFPLYGDKEELYDLLCEEADNLSMQEHRKKKAERLLVEQSFDRQMGEPMSKVFDMVELARDLCLGREK